MLILLHATHTFYYNLRDFLGRHPLKGIPVESETSRILNPSRRSPETTCPRVELIPLNSILTPFSPFAASPGNRAFKASSTRGTALGAVLADPPSPTDPDDNLKRSRPGGEETATWILLGRQLKRILMISEDDGGTATELEKNRLIEGVNFISLVSLGVHGMGRMDSMNENEPLIFYLQT